MPLVLPKIEFKCHKLEYSSIFSFAKVKTLLLIQLYTQKMLLKLEISFAKI